MQVLSHFGQGNGRHVSLSHTGKFQLKLKAAVCIGRKSGLVGIELYSRLKGGFESHLILVGNGVKAMPGSIIVPIRKFYLFHRTSKNRFFVRNWSTDLQQCSTSTSDNFVDPSVSLQDNNLNGWKCSN